jgi:predicted nucleic acid-binding Zn ribbon protein
MARETKAVVAALIMIALILVGVWLAYRAGHFIGAH